MNARGLRRRRRRPRRPPRRRRRRHHRRRGSGDHPPARVHPRTRIAAGPEYLQAKF